MVPLQYGTTGWWSVRPGNIWQDRAGARTTPVTAANDPVGTVGDLTTYGHDLLAAADNQRPAWKAAACRALFDGSNDTLKNPSVSALGTKWTIAWSGVLGAYNSSYRVMYAVGTKSTGLCYMNYWRTDNGFDSAVYGGSGDFSMAASQSLPSVWIATYDGTTRNLYQDGKLAYSGTMSADLAAGVSIGGFQDTTDLSACSFRDFAVFPSALNAAQVQDLSDYFR